MFYEINQSGHERISYLIFFAKYIKLTDNTSNKDFKSVKRPQEVEKFKLDRKIFSSLKIKNR